MGAWAQAITQGIGRIGNETYDAKQLGLDEKAKQLQLLQSQMALKELQQRMNLSQSEFGLRQAEEKRLEDQAAFEQKMRLQPKFLGFQKIGGRMLYGLQGPDGTVSVKEAEGFNDSAIAGSIEKGLAQLPPEARASARGAVGMWLQSGDYDQARKAVDQYLLQYGKSQMPGATTTTDTTTTQVVDTPNGPQLVQVPKHTVTTRGKSGVPASSPISVPYKVIAPAKSTNSEMNRSDLAVNVEENLDKLEDIVKRRPELFGPGAGWLTEARAWMGTSDTDIASLKQIRDNLGRALQGAHGMRSARGVEDAGNSVLNNFRNGPNAVTASIATARNSVKTFEKDVQRGGENDAPKVINYKIVNGELVPVAGNQSTGR